MDTNFYDVIVCGSELSGLVAAALLARRGLRVLLLGHDADRPAFEAGGVTLSRAPALLPPLESQPVARVLTELNCVQIIRRRAPVLAPGFQVVLPRHRFDVTADREPDRGAGLFRREIAREFPGDAEAIEAAVERLTTTSAVLDPLLASELTLPPDGFWERREVARLESLLPKPGTDLLAPLPAGHPVRAAVAAPAALSASFSPSDVGAAAEARAFDLARRGLHRLEGGYAALHAFLLEKIETFSGERREKVVPVEIVQRRGRAAGIRVRPRDETIGCEHLIWAGPTARMLALCPDKPSRKGREGPGGLRTTCYRYGVAMLVDPDALPEGMASRVFLIDDPARPLLEDNALVVTVGQPTARDPGRVPVWAECLVPAPAADSGPGYLRALRGRVRKQLGRLFPFFPRQLHVLASPFDGLPPELPGAAAPPAAIPPGPMPAVYGADGPRPMDLGGLPHASGIKNLYVAGRENLPGLGIEGELVSAWGVARLVTGGAQVKRDLLRREVLLSES
jgi:phytoene dehydrogenase-like protein